MKKNDLPSRQYLLECFVYDDGALIWRRRPLQHFSSTRVTNMWNAKNAGKVAGREMPTSRYRQVGLNGQRYLEHRIIASMHGLSTDDQIDHIDGNGLNNRIENLRPATQSENMKNNAGWAKKSSRVGVYQSKSGKWIAVISRNRYLGSFDTHEDAARARIEAEKREYRSFSPHLSRGI